jgi:hypothetical protein
MAGFRGEGYPKLMIREWFAQNLRSKTTKALLSGPILWLYAGVPLSGGGGFVTGGLNRLSGGGL